MKNSIIKNNEILVLDIVDMTSSGEGVAKYNGMTIFIDNTVIGDKVKAKIFLIKKNYAKAKVLEFLKKSSFRKKIDYCQNCGNCGGCTYSNIDYQKQLKLKEKTLKDALERIGGFKNLKILPILPSSEFNYRNKAQFKVDKSGLGFYKKRSHEIIPVKECRIEQEAINRILPLLNSIIRNDKLSIYNENEHKGLLRGILVRTNKDNEIIIVFIINNDTLPNQDEIIKTLKTNPNIIGIYLNINNAKGNTILGDKTITIYKKKDLIEKVGEKNFKISPESFFQVNTKQAEKLYEIVKEYCDLKKDEIILDLYCGTGSIGIYISDETTQLIGIELNEKAIKDAQYNANLNNLKNAQFLSGKAEEIVNKITNKPTCIILDPPRKGCDNSLLDFLLKISVPRIVYVSCNPATLARDLKILSTDYQIVKVQPIDLFPQTGHIESVTLLVKR